MANTWQGAFPHENLKTDGYERTSPVTAFPRERLRHPRHDRQRLGMDERLVFAQARGRRAEGLLHPGESARRPRGRKLRPLPAADPDSPQGDQGRLASVRAELLPALSTGGAPRRAGRHVDEPSWIPMHRQREESTMSDDHSDQNPQDDQKPQDNSSQRRDGINRRNILLGGTSIAAAAAAAGALPPAEAQAQETLPFPRTPSGSTANRTMQESVYSPRPAIAPHARQCAEHPHRSARRCRAGAGGNLRRRDQHADARPHPQWRRFLQPVPHHRDVLADPRRVAHRPQPPSRRQRPDHRAGERLGRLFRHHPEDECHDCRGAEELRLRHVGLGQVAQHADQRDHRRRPLRLLAVRLRLRIFLRLPGRRGVAVRAASRAQHDRRASQSAGAGQEVPPQRRPRRRRHQLDAQSEGIPA